MDLAASRISETTLTAGAIAIDTELAPLIPFEDVVVTVEGATILHIGCSYIFSSNATTGARVGSKPFSHGHSANWAVHF